MINTNINAGSTHLNYCRKLVSFIEILEPGQTQTIESIELFTAFSDNWEAWVDYQGQRVRMFWFLGQHTKSTDSLFNQAASNILQQPTTFVRPGDKTWKSVTSLKCGPTYVRGEAYIVTGGFFSRYVPLPRDAPPDHVIMRDADNAIGTDRAFVSEDYTGQRYFLSIADDKTPDEIAAVDSDLCWAKLRYC